MGQTVSFSRIFRKLVKYLWLIVIVTILTALIGFFMTRQVGSNIYKAEVTLYSTTYVGSAANAMIMNDYAEIIRSKMVADLVVNSLGDLKLNARQLRSMVNTYYKDNSAIFSIDVSSNDPGTAIVVANAFADVFISQVNLITGQNSVKILDAADTVGVSYNAKSEQMNTRLIYAAIGFLLTCIIIGLTEILNTRVSEIGDSTLNDEIKLLGVIPRHDI